jgi:hypothetical protein
LKGVYKKQMERTQTLAQIFDADSASLSRIEKAIHSIYEVLEQELSRVGTQEQSAVFKGAVLKTSNIISQTMTVLNEAQSALVVPESMRTAEPF